MKNEKIIIGSDHAGYQLKKKILNYNFENNILFYDIGTHNEDSVDYPDYGNKLSEKINCGDYEKGILICGSGVGMSIVANRYKNVRAALCFDEKMSILAREHNDANIIVFGSRLISFQQVIKCIQSFISTKFENGRHAVRINKINNL